MKQVFQYIAFIMTVTAFTNQRRGIQSTDTPEGGDSDYYDNRRRYQPFPPKRSTVTPKYRSQNENKPVYPTTGVNKRTNPRGYDDVSETVGTTTSNRSDRSNKVPKMGNKGMKPPMGKGMPGPGSLSNSQGGNKMNGTVKWILIFSIIVVSVIILLLTIYALWVWCSPVETNRIVIEEEMKSEGMTDDELKRFKMRFGRD